MSADPLFHKIDDFYEITKRGKLSKEIQSDWKRLQNFSIGYGKSIEDMLYSKYPNVFEGNKIKEEYRGISDILNGMSKCQIKLGYGHKKEYWAQPLKVEKETWAQFGRILYDNNPKVLNMAYFLFEDTFKECLKILEELSK